MCLRRQGHAQGLSNGRLPSRTVVPVFSCHGRQANGVWLSRGPSQELRCIISQCSSNSIPDQEGVYRMEDCCTGKRCWLSKVAGDRPGRSPGSSGESTSSSKVAPVLGTSSAFQASGSRSSCLTGDITFLRYVRCTRFATLYRRAALLATRTTARPSLALPGPKSNKKRPTAVRGLPLQHLSATVAITSCSARLPYLLSIRWHAASPQPTPSVPVLYTEPAAQIDRHADISSWCSCR